MGIHRLASWLSAKNVGKQETLTKTSSNKTLVIDGNGWIYEYYDVAVTKNNKLPSQRLLNGSYKKLEEYVAWWISVWKSVNVNLIFVFDASKKNDDETNYKAETWQLRREEKNGAIDQGISFCYDKVLNPQIKDSLPLPPLALDVFRSTLHKLGQHVHIAYGEGDPICASLVAKKNAYAVISSDTDFCIYSQCRYIPFSSIEMDNDNISYNTVTPEDICNKLNLESHDQLIDLAIIMGNDYTRPLHLENKDYNIEVKNPEELSIHIKTQGWLKQFIGNNSNLKEAIDYSINTYTYENINDFEWKPSDKNLCKMMQEGIGSLRYYTNSMSMVLEEPIGSSALLIDDLYDIYHHNSVQYENDLWEFIHPDCNTSNNDLIWDYNGTEFHILLALRYMMTKKEISRTITNRILKQYILNKYGIESKNKPVISAEFMTGSSKFQMVYKYICYCL